ncbi:MAG: hypothetical protein JWP34_5198 [Massilia sp.]|nr:hypothetical protein [Massilia sp.]
MRKPGRTTKHKGPDRATGLSACRTGLAGWWWRSLPRHDVEQQRQQPVGLSLGGNHRLEPIVRLALRLLRLVAYLAFDNPSHGGNPL